MIQKSSNIKGIIKEKRKISLYKKKGGGGKKRYRDQILKLINRKPFMACPVLKSANDAMNEKLNSIIITRRGRIIIIIKEET